MHDTLELHRARAGLPAVPPQRADVLDDVRLHRELRAAALARRGRARQGLAAEQDPRRPLAADGDAARAVRLHVGAPGQAAAVHGPGVRAGRRVGRVALAGLVAARRPGPPRRAAAGQRPQPRLPRDRRRCGRRTPTRPASTGSTPTTRPATSTRSCASATTARCWPASRTSPPSRTRATASGCPSPGAGTRSSTPTPTSTSAPGVGNFGGVEAGERCVARPAGLGHAAGAAARRALAALRPRLDPPRVAVGQPPNSSSSSATQHRHDLAPAQHDGSAPGRRRGTCAGSDTGARR